MRSKRGAISLQIFHSFLGARDLENWGVHPENDVCFRGSHKNARQRPRSPVEPMWRCQTPPTAGTQHGEGEVLVGVSNLSLDSANSIPHRGGGGVGGARVSAKCRLTVCPVSTASAARPPWASRYRCSTSGGGESGGCSPRQLTRSRRPTAALYSRFKGPGFL